MQYYPARPGRPFLPETRAQGMLLLDCWIAIAMIGGLWACHTSLGRNKVMATIPVEYLDDSKPVPQFISLKAQAADEWCIAATGYGEARNQGYVGLKAVEDVIANRMIAAGTSDACAIVYSRAQFSVWNAGDPNKPLLTRYHLSHLRGYDRAVWNMAREIAHAEMVGVEDSTGGATHYATATSHPKWEHKFAFLARIGAHIFRK